MSATTATAREAILSRIGATLSKTDHEARERAVAEWPSRSARPPRPARAAAPPSDRVARFADEARRNGAVVMVIEGQQALPAALVGYMRDHNLGGRFRLAAHPWLESVDWSVEKMLEPETGRADPGDVLSVNLAAAGAAETGSVMFVSGPQSPASLHVLPLHHVSVVEAASIDASYEGAVLRARAQVPEMPRVLNIITGPSRTADIEQTLLMGAHGPQSEVVIIVGGEGL